MPSRIVGIEGGSGIVYGYGGTCAPTRRSVRVTGGFAINGGVLGWMLGFGDVQAAVNKSAASVGITDNRSEQSLKFFIRRVSSTIGYKACTIGVLPILRDFQSLADFGSLGFSM